MGFDVQCPQGVLQVVFNSVWKSSMPALILGAIPRCSSINPTPIRIQSLTPCWVSIRTILYLQDKHTQAFSHIWNYRIWSLLVNVKFSAEIYMTNLYCNFYRLHTRLCCDPHLTKTFIHPKSMVGTGLKKITQAAPITLGGCHFETRSRKKCKHNPF